MNAWYVVQTRPRDETRAQRHLAQQGFEVYLPCFTKKRRHARRTQMVAAPLFPGYMFTRLDLARDRWRSINGTVGVNRLLCHGDRPTPVPDGIVDDLRAREDGRGMLPLASLLVLERGARVRIVDGALSDRIGIYERMTDSERIVILLDFLGRAVRIELPRDAIDAA